MSQLVFFYFFVVVSQNTFGVMCGRTAKPNVRTSRPTAFDERLAKASTIKSYMNDTIDPCTDFYSFACGKFPTLHPAEESDTLMTNMFELMAIEFQQKAKTMLKANLISAASTTDKKVKAFYQSCDTFVRQTTKSSYRRSLLALTEEFGGLPALKGNTWKVLDFDWLVTVGQIIKKYGKGIILDVSVFPDLFRTTVNRLHIGHSDYDSKSMFVNNDEAEDLQIHKEVIAEHLENYLGLNKKYAEELAEEFVRFEISLATGLEDDFSELSLGEMSILTTTREMTEKYSSALNIEKLVQTVLGRSITDQISEYSESYQRNLINVFQKTPLSTIANYIMYKLIKEFLTEVPFLAIENTQSHREKVCVTETMKYFGKYLQNKLYRSHNTATIERDINDMWLGIKRAFGENLRSNKYDWISMATRQKAVDKLNAMTIKINSYEEKDFAAEFRDLKIDNSNFIQNVKNILQQRSRYHFSKFNQKPDEITTDGNTLMYTPAMIQYKNMVTVPVSVLLEPNFFWGRTYPRALKYSSLGWLLTHEVMHAFDELGCKFNKHGNHELWWDAHSRKAFNERKQCFIDQYSKYSYGGRLLPRRNLQMENIADNGGLRLIYDVYLRWLQATTNNRGEHDRETLPTVQYTNKQLFFIGAAQMWCDDVDPLIQNSEILTDIHPPKQVRVNGAFSNFAEFAKEFSCGPNTPMNRGNNRCEIW